MFPRVEACVVADIYVIAPEHSCIWRIHVDPLSAEMGSCRFFEQIGLNCSGSPNHFPSIGVF